MFEFDVCKTNQFKMHITVLTDRWFEMYVAYRACPSDLLHNRETGVYKRRQSKACTYAVHTNTSTCMHIHAHAVLEYTHNQAGGVEAGGGYCLRGRGLAL